MNDEFRNIIVAHGEARLSLKQAFNLWRKLYEGEFDDAARIAAFKDMEELRDTGWLMFPSVSEREAYKSLNGLMMPKYVNVSTPEEFLKGTEADRDGWLPCMAFGINLYGTKYAMARRINDWLARMRGKPIHPVPSRERSLEIFGDEKALEHCIGDGDIRGTYFDGRLPAAMIGVWSPSAVACKVDLLEDNGRPALIVENLHTWKSVSEWNRSRRMYSAVLHGDGYESAALHANMRKAMKEVNARSFEYFGDMDIVGMEIPMTLNEGNLIDIYPAWEMYARLVECKVVRKKDLYRNMTEARVKRVFGWIRRWMPCLSGFMLDMWSKNMWMPQEALSRDKLATV